MVFSSFDFIVTTSTSDGECVWVCDCECVKRDTQQRVLPSQNKKRDLTANHRPEPTIRASSSLTGVYCAEQKEE